MQNDKASLWDSILREKSFTAIDINTFKNEGANTRISQYSCKTHSILFFKTLLFHMASQFKEEELALLKKVPNRHIGGGTLNICYEDLEIDLDYLLALEEVKFLKSILKKIKNILEIGAGYGRTCHTILSLFPNIQRYDIIDLPEMLDLSNSYLKKASILENYKKINFISPENSSDSLYDLVINVDSMQEMSSETVFSYLKYINKYSKAFYSKNTIGKFEPHLCGWAKSENSELALKAGILKEKLNIFCPLDLKKGQSNFLSRFKPGEEWRIEDHSHCLPWPHYYQALFIKHA